jgi:hypothetical protein
MRRDYEPAILVVVSTADDDDHDLAIALGDALDDVHSRANDAQPTVRTADVAAPDAGSRRLDRRSAQ